LVMNPPSRGVSGKPMIDGRRTLPGGPTVGRGMPAAAQGVGDRRHKVRGAVVGALALLGLALLSTGCMSVRDSDECVACRGPLHGALCRHPHGDPEAPPGFPRELTKVSQPDYIIEP